MRKMQHALNKQSKDGGTPVQFLDPMGHSDDPSASFGRSRASNPCFPTRNRRRRQRFECCAEPFGSLFAFKTCRRLLRASEASSQSRGPGMFMNDEDF